MTALPLPVSASCPSLDAQAAAYVRGLKLTRGRFAVALPPLTYARKASS